MYMYLYRVDGWLDIYLFSIYNIEMMVYKSYAPLFGQKALKGRLVNHHVAHGPEPLAALLLLLQQLPPPRYVTRMQLRQDVLSKRLDGLARNHLVAHNRLDNHLCTQELAKAKTKKGEKRTKHLAVHVLLKLGHPLPAQAVDLRGVHHPADGVHGLSVDEQLQLDQLALAPAGVFVVERRIALAIRETDSASFHQAYEKLLTTRL